MKALTDSVEEKAFVDAVTPDEWRALADYQIEKAKGRNGQIPFTPNVKSVLCANIGVEAYNAFIEKYNK